MTPSLSVIVPVANAEKVLAPLVLQLLEVLPDLAARFEILIVDDASTDQTAEVAQELRRTFPQVRIVRHGWQWGMPAAVLTGRTRSRNEVVLALDRLDSAGVRALASQWQAALRLSQSGPDAEPSVASSPSLQAWSRREPAHRQPAQPREQSFLRHLRQLSAAPART